MDVALGGHLSGAESHYVRTLFEEHLVCIASGHTRNWRMAAGSGPLPQPAARGCTRRLTTKLRQKKRSTAWRKSAASGAVAVTFHTLSLPAVVADSDLIATLADSVARRFPSATRTFSAA